MEILAEYRVMQESLIRLIGITDGIGKQIEEMENIATRLEIFWDGKANDEYLLNLSAGLLNAKLFNQKIMRCGNFLSYALSRYQQSERKIRELIEIVK